MVIQHQYRGYQHIVVFCVATGSQSSHVDPCLPQGGVNVVTDRCSAALFNSDAEKISESQATHELSSERLKCITGVCFVSCKVLAGIHSTVQTS